MDVATASAARGTKVHAAPVRSAARAKINLDLLVTGRRADGYHELDTLVTFADVGDVVEARTSASGPPIGIDVQGPFAAAMREACPKAGDNLVVRAAAALHALASRNGIAPPPVHLTLHKHLPIASGVGGGSADAAATIGALSRLWNLPPRLEGRNDLPALLGADVAMCLAGRPLRATGAGERLEPVRLPALDLVLLNPGVQVSTADVFARPEARRSPARELPDVSSVEALIAHLRATGNDLVEAARAVGAPIDECLAALEDGLFAGMSGSGATCFAIFSDRAAADASAARIRQAHPGWWVTPATTVAA